MLLGDGRRQREKCLLQDRNSVKPFMFIRLSSVLLTFLAFNYKIMKVPEAFYAPALFLLFFLIDWKLYCYRKCLSIGIAG